MDKPNTVLGHGSTILASQACKPVLPLFSASAEIIYSLSGPEKQKGFEPTGKSPQKINESDKRLENMTHKERLNIRIVYLKQ